MMATELCDLAAAVAVEAGALVATMAVNARLSPSTKSSSSDLVTDADKAAEDLLTSRILAARPDDGILGEEGSSAVGTSPVVWHLDPIDGTTNYVYGIPAFSVSVAAAIDDEVVAGVVFNPSTDELYRATLGGGATCNGRSLSVRAAPSLAQALIGTGFGYSPNRRRAQGQVVAELLPQVRDIRRFGSAALDLCAVAAGQIDAYYERGLNRWDLAAGALIAAEAGARVENLRGGPADVDFVLAAADEVFDELRNILAGLDADAGP